MMNLIIKEEQKLSPISTVTAKLAQPAPHLVIVPDAKNLATQASKTAKLNTPPKRKTNKELREREWLKAEEVKALIEAAGKQGRYKLRDKALITVAYQHALRVSELTALRWEDFDLSKGTVYIRRLKGSDDSEHYLSGSEIRLLKRLKREYPNSAFVFNTERGTALSARHVRTIVKRAGDKAGIDNCHPHQLRHSKGYHMANTGVPFRDMQGYLGHKNPMHTSQYTKLDKRRFRGIEEDLG